MSRRILAALHRLALVGLVLGAVAWQAEAKPDRDRDRDQDRTQLQECATMARDRDRIRDHASLNEYVDQYQKNRYRERLRYRDRIGCVQNSSESPLKYRWQQRHRNRRG